MTSGPCLSNDREGLCCRIIWPRWTADRTPISVRVKSQPGSGVPGIVPGMSLRRRRSGRWSCVGDDSFVGLRGGAYPVPWCHDRSGPQPIVFPSGRFDDHGVEGSGVEGVALPRPQFASSFPVDSSAVTERRAYPSSFDLSPSRLRGPISPHRLV